MSKTDRTCFTNDDITAFLVTLHRLHSGLLSAELTTVERQRMGGVLQPYGAPLVHELGQALVNHPDSFPEAAGRGEMLQSGQERAFAWLFLCNRLRQITKLAEDAYLATAAEVVGMARTYIRPAILGQPPAEVVGRDFCVRNLSLLPAFLLVHHAYNANRKKKANPTAPEAPAASPPPDPRPAAPKMETGMETPQSPEAPPPTPAQGKGAPPKSGQKRRSEKALREHRRIVLQRKFTEYLTEPSPSRSRLY